MKRTLYFVMALALVLGFTQCKKEQVNTPENETKTVNITLKVGGNGGSRHTINTENGDVDFQDGDVIYVGNGSTYIGTLTRNGGVFSGSITEPADETEIYFYFVGGLNPSSTPVAGTTPSFTVDISNQSTQMPVLSCNHVTYYSSTTSYSCTLQNQCALVKFTTASTTAPVHVGGLYTEAKIDFANHSITHTDTKGFVNLYPDADDNTAKWAVLLPQTSFSGIEGVVADKGYTMQQPQTTISVDGFITGDDFSISSTPSHNRYLQWATGDLTLEDGDQVYGTLGGQYKVSIAAGATTNGVTLHDVKITCLSETTDFAGITCPGNATIVLEGTNNVIGGGGTVNVHRNPGIYIAPNYTLTIQGSGTLNVSSNTSSANSNVGAGIGGAWANSDAGNCGNIVINGGTINATGGYGCAGIGAGYGRTCQNITIAGGSVTATGGTNAAGIGSGFSGNGSNSSCGDISISDGTVNASGGSHATGIGTGYANGAFNNTCGDISISGGTVTAVGLTGGAGIGSGLAYCNQPGYYARCGNISITGGTVTATGGSGGTLNSNKYRYAGGAGIGTGSGYLIVSSGTIYGCYSSCGDIAIESGASVTATKGGGTYSATNSIGLNNSGYNSGTCGTITIGGTLYWDGSAYQNGGDTYLPTSPLVYPAPTPAETTVTWINYHIQQIFLGNGEGEYYKGVGVQLDDDLEESYWDGTDVYLYEMGMLTFQIDTDGAYAEYDIKKIEIYYSYFSGNLPEGGGWSNDGSKLTWDDGLTPSVILQNQGPDPDHMSIEVTEVVFTLQKSTK